MNHPSLFDPPMSRRKDPDSSHRAADRHEKVGKAEQNRRLLLNALRRFPWRTGKELGEITKLGQHEAQRRLPELRDRGDVTNVSTTGQECRSSQHPEGYEGPLRWRVR